MKFSIIIPVYNVEKYVKKCFDSILKQTYYNYEVVIVCDECSDNSEKIVDEYVKKHKSFNKVFRKKTGLSIAKNIGIDNVKGDYILFLDGDDYLEEELLERLNNEIESNKDLELIRFQVQTIDKDNSIDKYSEKEFEVMDGIKAFNEIFRFHFIEPSWAYCYKADFWKKNKFRFLDNCIAEDYGLTPYIIYKAKKVKIIDYIGYNYVQRENSIMNNSDYDKKVSKMNDILKQANRLYENIHFNDDTVFFYLFINNSVLTYVTSLKYKDYKKIMKKMDKNKLFECFPKDGIRHKIRKFIFKLNPYIFKNYLEKFL